MGEVVTTDLFDGWWGNADYLFATVRGERIQPLVTTSPAGTARTIAGVLGQPTTVALFGDRAGNTQLRTGGRANLGYWFEADKQFGIEAGFLFLGGATTSFSAASDGSAILARPFLDDTAEQTVAEI